MSSEIPEECWSLIIDDLDINTAVNISRVNKICNYAFRWSFRLQKVIKTRKQAFEHVVNIRPEMEDWIKGIWDKMQSYGDSYDVINLLDLKLYNLFPSNVLSVRNKQELLKKVVEHDRLTIVYNLYPHLDKSYHHDDNNNYGTGGKSGATKRLKYSNYKNLLLNHRIVKLACRSKAGYIFDFFIEHLDKDSFDGEKYINISQKTKDSSWMTRVCERVFNIGSSLK